MTKSIKQIYNLPKKYCYKSKKYKYNKKITSPDKLTATPIVIITSNGERDLPNAFLRRCFFHYFEPPNAEELYNIIKAHFGEQLPEILTEEIIETFLELRDNTEKVSNKRISTSELLDWIKALLQSDLKQVPEKLQEGIPFLGTLLKTPDEVKRYWRQRRDSE